MNLFLLLVLLTAAPALAATDTPCEPVESAAEDGGLPSQSALVRWARSHLGTGAAGIIGALDWEQLSWSGTEGRYLAPPSPSGWSVRLAAPEPLQLTASLTLKPGACLTIRSYGTFGEEGFTAKEGSLVLEGPWRFEVTLSVGGQTAQLLSTEASELSVDWRRDDGRPKARLLAKDLSGSEFDLPVPRGSSKNTWRTLTHSRASTAWQDVLLALLSRNDVPPRQREAAVRLLAAKGHHLSGRAHETLRALLLAKRLPPKEARALDLVARTDSEGREASAFFTVEGDAPPRIWVDGQELTGWAPRDKGFEVGTALHGFVLVRAEWADGPTQDFWAALGPGVRLHLTTDHGPRQESPPEGERCIAVEGAGVRWSCEPESVLRQGPLDCSSPAYLQSAITLESEQKNGTEGHLTFVPSLPGRYTFRWHGPHIDGSWAPGCAGP